jgi:hypothetical protein
MQQRQKEPRLETAATPGKQENTQQDECQGGSDTDHGAACRQASSSVFHENSKNEYLHIL